MKRWARSRAEAVTPKTLLKRLSFSDSTKSSILGHIFRRKWGKSKHVYGTGANQELRYLNYPPPNSTLWTVGPSGFQRSSLLLSAAARV